MLSFGKYFCQEIITLSGFHCNCFRRKEIWTLVSIYNQKLHYLGFYTVKLWGFLSLKFFNWELNIFHLSHLTLSMFEKWSINSKAFCLKWYNHFCLPKGFFLFFFIEKIRTEKWWPSSLWLRVTVHMDNLTSTFDKKINEFYSHFCQNFNST